MSELSAGRGWHKDEVRNVDSGSMEIMQGLVGHQEQELAENGL